MLGILKELGRWGKVVKAWTSSMETDNSVLLKRPFPPMSTNRSPQKQDTCVFVTKIKLVCRAAGNSLGKV